MATDKLTLSQMAERYNKTAKTFRKHVIDLGIPHERLGRSMYFDPNVVSAYLLVTEKEEKPKVKLLPVRQAKRNNVVSMKFAEAR
jgi:hypothetical protein